METRKDAMTCGSRVRGLVRRRPTRARADASAIKVALTYASPPRKAES